MGRSETPIELRLMNDQVVVDVPLWRDGEPIDGSELGLSPELLRDLVAFAERWNASREDVFTDHRRNLILRTAASMKSRVSPTVRRIAKAKAEDDAMRRVGEELRSRLQFELGRGFLVTYLH